MVDICVNSNSPYIWIPNGHGAASSAALRLVYREDAQNCASVAGLNPICQVTICRDQNVSRQLSYRNLVWSFLELQDLLINELRLFMDDEVGVERTLGTFTLAFDTATRPW